MKIVPLILSLLALTALPAYAQLGPAGVPGAPGLVPEPAPVATPAPQSADAKKEATSKIPPQCAKTKNVERCIAQAEARQKAEAACKGKPKAKYDQCVRQQLTPKKK